MYCKIDIAILEGSGTDFYNESFSTQGSKGHIISFSIIIFVL